MGDAQLANADQWTGFAGNYDRFRPAPPADIPNLLRQYGRVERPALVVDLGCGTGHSTRIWAEHADKIIGIEPNDDMRKIAQAQTHASNIYYQRGFGNQTSLPDAHADIVTAANALHWMEPLSTTTEIARILRSGGVFAQIDYKWPPCVFDWEIEQAIIESKRRCDEINAERNLNHVNRFDTAQAFEQFKTSNEFRHTNEIMMHTKKVGSAEDIIGLWKTLPVIQKALEDGIDEDVLGITAIRAVAKRVMGNKTKPWFLSYRVRIAVK